MPSVARPRARLPFLALCALFAPALPAAQPAEDYPTHPDSLVRPGVPVGELLKLTFAESRIFPGTTREVQVYVPRQYDPARPACVHVNQDRIQWNAPVVFDNLIAKGDIPVLIGVFVAPGVVKAADGAQALDRYNRSFEYDGLGDAYARFVLEELLPFVERQRTADGRPLRLSRSGNDRAIAGSSSGAIAAWTAAWERPDAFSRVFSGIGTYVGLRGGDRYPTLVRKFEPRRIRVFLQDGSNDNNIYGGDWWMANQTLQRALEFSGYEVRHVWGEGGHNARHATALFPDALRWLWSGWPQPVGFAAPTRNAVLAAVLIPGEDWTLVGEGYGLTEGPVALPGGEVLFNDIRASRTYRIGRDGRVTPEREDTQRANGQALTPDGTLVVAEAGRKSVVAHRAGTAPRILASDLAGNDLVVAHNGNVYVTVPPAGSSNDLSAVWLLRPDGSRVQVDSSLRFANGIALSPDQTLLYVADYRSHWVYSYQIQPDGSLRHRQRYFHLHEPDDEDMRFADGLKVDREAGCTWRRALGSRSATRPGG